MNPAAADILPGSLVGSIAGAAWTIGLAIGVGAVALGLAEAAARRRDRLPGDTLVGPAALTAWGIAGMGLLPQAWLALSALGQLRPPVVIAVAAILSVAGVVLARKRLTAALAWPPWETLGGGLRAVRGVAAGAIVAIALAALAFALLPSVFYDDLVYHLGLPRQALLTGSWPAIPEFHYAFMPGGWDANSVLSLSLSGGSGAQLVNVVTLVALAAAAWRLGRLGGGDAPAAAGAALLVVGPMFLALGSLAANDLACGLALASALEHLLATKGRRPVATGLLAATAWGAKYTALAPIVGLGFVLLLVAEGAWQHRARAFVVFGATAAIVPCAWTLRALFHTGNPVYPAFWSVLGGRGFDASSAARMAFEAAHGSVAARGLAAFPLSIRDLLLHSDSLGRPSGLGTFVPVALLGLVAARRVRHARPLLVLAATTWIAWCLTSLNLRYAVILLVALVPFASAAIAWTLERLHGRSRVLVAAGLAALLAAAAFDAVTSQIDLIRLDRREGTTGLGALRRDYLVSRVNLAAAGRWMSRNLPPDAYLLSVGDARMGLLPRRSLVSSFYDRPAMLRFVQGAGGVSEVERRLDAEGITHVVVNFRELGRRVSDYGYFTRFAPDEVRLFDSWLKGLVPVARFDDTVVYERSPG